jgi:hypothetical protein
MFDKLQKMIDSLDDPNIAINEKIKKYNRAKDEITELSTIINNVYHDINSFTVKKTKINKKTDPMSLYDVIKNNQDKLKHIDSLDDGVILYKETMTYIEQLSKWLDTEENRIYEATQKGKGVDILDITELFIDKPENDDEDEDENEDSKDTLENNDDSELDAIIDNDKSNDESDNDKSNDESDNDESESISENESE